MDDSRTDTERVVYRADGEIERQVWNPSIHMPRRASRITLEITRVQVQRVQEISPEDCGHEGADFAPHKECDFSLVDKCPFQANFQRSWDAAYSKRGLGWGENPWVWAVGFKRV